jgi:hypothetical protein
MEASMSILAGTILGLLVALASDGSGFSWFFTRRVVQEGTFTFCP